MRGDRSDEWRDEMMWEMRDEMMEQMEYAMTYGRMEEVRPETCGTP